MVTQGAGRDNAVTVRSVRHAIAALGLGAAAAVLVGCPSTEFFYEGQGQASDRSTGTAPAGSIGACKLPRSKRPPIVSEALWDDLRVCNKRTPRRYLRLGYGKVDDPPDAPSERRVRAIMKALEEGNNVKDGNVRMSGMLRSVRREALTEPELAVRVERSSGRTFPCDYTYLFNTTEKRYKELEGSACPARAFNPKARAEQCLFDERRTETLWLTSAWSCLAFTETVGEGQSCYRLCAYDDHCAAQSSCAAPDFDLILCSLGVCLPEKVKGLF